MSIYNLVPWIFFAVQFGSFHWMDGAAELSDVQSDSTQEIDGSPNSFSVVHDVPPDVLVQIFQRLESVVDARSLACVSNVFAQGKFTFLSTRW